MLYEDVKIGNLLVPLLREIQAGKFAIRDQKVHFHDIIVPESPWMRTKVDPDRHCDRWLNVYFNYYKIIPRACMNCWKIAVRVGELRDLMALKKIQEKMALPSKCGLETRWFIPKGKRWVAMWYSPLDGGLEMARELHRKIELRVHTELGIDTKVALKRACSEMEFHHGPSDKWQYKWQGIEAQLDNLIVGQVSLEDHGEEAKRLIVQRWIEKAWEESDPSVWDFASKESFPDGPVNYARSIHRAQDFVWPAPRKETPDGIIAAIE